MNKQLSDLYPSGLWKNFYNLTQIPRPSKHETKVIDYVKKFGEKLGLKTITDGVGNVIIKKPATSGMENRQGIILQAHLDMVPQKNNDKVHDFTRDPIEAVVDGDWVRANKTTLGADNGIGVSSILAILESDNVRHGPIEALFTVDEETGMTGAFALKPGSLTGSILINTDSEEEGELCIGCAGGIDASITFDYKPQKAPGGYQAYKIVVKGLKGGHSGVDINLGRANSNLLLVRILWRATFKFRTLLASLNGGDLRNAIPREASAIVLVPEDIENEFIDFLNGHESILKNEYHASEPGMEIHFEKTKIPANIIDEDTQNRLISAVYTCPNGVIRMSDEIEDLVETSTNLAIVKTAEKEITIQCLLRSSVDSAKDDLAARLRALFELAGAKSYFAGGYPGWKPNPESAILSTMKDVYKNKFGKFPEVKAIHAGLECGIIGGIFPGLDMISCGPTIKYPHSPDEKVNIQSVGKYWDFLLDTLMHIPAKV